MLHQQLREALRYIQNAIIKELVVKHPDRAEADRFFNYPYAAIEESLANAVYHKAYDVREPIADLAEQLTAKYGSGFDKRFLYRYVKFYHLYPEIVATLRPQSFLTDAQKTYLLGKLYESRKHVHGATQPRQPDGTFGRRHPDANGPGCVREQLIMALAEVANHFLNSVGDLLRKMNEFLAK